MQKTLRAGVVLSAIALAVSAFAANAGFHWVGTWAAAPQLAEPENRPPAPGLDGATLRQVVRVSIGGKLIRLRLTNVFGNSAVSLNSVHIAQSAGGSAIKADSDRVFTFSGAPAVTIPPGAAIVSDELGFDLRPLADVTISIQFNDAPSAITAHPGSRTTSFIQPGDFVGASSLPHAVSADHWYFINGIDVLADSPAAALVVLGDSITDGRGSAENQNRRWTDYLARRLQADEHTAHVGVLNAGIGGNRLLPGGVGPNALARLDRDVLSQSSVRWMIVLEGINDVGISPRDGPDEISTVVISAYEQLIRRVHAHHLRVYGATIMPFGGSFYASPARESERQKINRWIRTSGQFDGVIDFDAAVRAADDPTRLAVPLDCGDHLHLSDAGYEAMANAIDLKLFRETSAGNRIVGDPAEPLEQTR